MQEPIEILPELKKVKPTNTLSFLYFGTMPCERQAAAVSNRTRKSMQEGDIRAVAYRYLQNQFNETHTSNQIVFFGLLTLSLFYTLSVFTCFFVKDLEEKGYSDEFIAIATQLLLLVAGITFTYPSFNIPPNLANTLRYHTAKEASGTWLSQKIGRDIVNKLAKLPYDDLGFFKTNELLDELKAPKAKPRNVPSRFKELSGIH